MAWIIIVFFRQHKEKSRMDRSCGIHHSSDHFPCDIKQLQLNQYNRAIFTVPKSISWKIICDGVFHITKTDEIPKIWLVVLCSSDSVNRVFHEHTEFTTKKESSNKMLPHWRLNLDPSYSGSMLSSLSHWGKCYLGEIRLYIVMLYWFSLNDLSPRLKWCSNRRQFKHIPSSNCLNGSERRALVLNGWGPRFNAQWESFWCWIFVSYSKACDANIAIIVNSVCLWKTLMAFEHPDGYCTQTSVGSNDMYY